ncbi:Mg/Co/Ni transporter MgtE with CBS domain [Mycolicibacterium rhodesiae NBB3]|uniref:Mg/Co/Ni transporter MgtE with CBS domain n=1 Tax=Mycolicibacterium rhodesiae (strain NBB3) TaxID=710685 RepID=G8RRJ0_MYCRN|nr:magnesium transporter [Mycolicibacterium rhodesiae]AEV76493.1 Mg/Co/Ni transporter MgtE with CBS domain [Mycolicibacterium rhodesiae NBB3]
MLLLSTVVGRWVEADGRRVGRLADLVVTAADADLPTVRRILVRGNHARTVSVPWTDVDRIGPGHIALRSGSETLVVESAAEGLSSDEVLVVRDILDSQIIDIAGQRLARVADIVLARSPSGLLEIVGVEVGFGALLRRMGFRRLAARMAPDAVRWSDLHLASKRGHTIQLATKRSAVHRLGARDLAVLVTKLDTESATGILSAKGPAMAADVIRVSQPEVAERVLRAMPAATAADVVATMPADHAAHWRRRLSDVSFMRGRRLLRSRAWSRRRHPKRGELP